MILTSQSGKKLLVSGLSGCSVRLCLIFDHLASCAFTHTLFKGGEIGQLIVSQFISFLCKYLPVKSAVLLLSLEQQQNG
jgi:hypothetical protein